ncbi:hypothetical protein HBI84_247710 [Parastagonospora nodorum]|nr:hypothetical protein HBI84_247710 [Parastagonospora nodorum]
MVPHDWIPASGIAFFTLLLQRLKVQWLMFCDSVDISLSQRRDDQLQAQGDSGDLIRLLKEDALNLARLRSVLRGQIQSAKTFTEEYCQSYDREGGRRTIQDAINEYDVEASERIRQLEQTVMDLLHIEFAWVSSNEARRSMGIATSVKRLSWITFIFLPAMFALSLFGMNVNILESNPD